MKTSRTKLQYVREDGTFGSDLDYIYSALGEDYLSHIWAIYFDSEYGDYKMLSLEEITNLGYVQTFSITGLDDDSSVDDLEAKVKTILDDPDFRLTDVFEDYSALFNIHP